LTAEIATYEIQCICAPLSSANKFLATSGVVLYQVERVLWSVVQREADGITDIYDVLSDVS